MAVYYFDGEGKFIRPRLAITMANAINTHLQVKEFLQVKRCSAPEVHPPFAA